MTDSFGGRLRAERERRQIALTSIAAATKIGLSLLEGLERDDVSHWPSGIFRRSFIRSYAEAVGLQADVVAREFLERFPDPADRLSAPLDAEQPSTQIPENRSFFGLNLRLVDLIGRTPRIKLRGTPDPILSPSPSRTLDLPAAARLCTELAQVTHIDELPQLLERILSVLHGVGLVVWISDETRTELIPALAVGYSESIRAGLRPIRHDEPNPTGIAFRDAQTHVLTGTSSGHVAIAVPLMAPQQCFGVFAVELYVGDNPLDSVEAVATFFAAQLAALFAGSSTSPEATEEPQPDPRPSTA